MEDRPSEYHTELQRILRTWEKDEEEKRGCLYFISNLSLETQCALEILSGLIQALADSTESLGKLTWPDEFDAHPDEAEHGCKLLHSMSKALVASGLVPNIGSSSQNVSGVDSTDEVKESTPDGTVAEEAQQPGIELQPLHLTK
jgi:hypothetical protein